MMIIYLIVALDLLTPVLLKNGIPMQTGESIPAESNRIAYEITGLESYIKDKEKLSNLFGWALIAPEDGISADALERVIVLISDKRKYFFPVISIYRDPELPEKFAKMDVNLDPLGFNALIAEDALKPGKYRVGLVFRDTSTGSVYYWDKPAYYIVKTPNTSRASDVAHGAGPSSRPGRPVRPAAAPTPSRSDTRFDADPAPCRPGLSKIPQWSLAGSSGWSRAT